MCVLLLLVLVFFILSIAYVTLFERHVLSFSQNRVGPAKVFLLGVVQPILDGLKLMSKEQLVMNKAGVFFFFLMPGGVFFILFFEIFCVPFFFFFFNFQYSFLFLLCLIGCSIYFVMISSLVSKSKYSLIGGLRSSSQSVSFEIVFTFFLFCFMFPSMGFEMSFSFNLVNFFLLSCYLFMVLAELARAPFDFSEGESELVSGFNTEFSSVTFILLFLGEYGFLLFFCVLGGGFFFADSLGVFVFFFVILFLRSVFPRYRYDLLMFFFWKILLPISLVFFLYFFIINMW